MPVTLNGMSRVIYKGIPVWKNSAGDLFMYEPGFTDLIPIGTEAGGFSWEAGAYTGRLEQFREGLAPRPRTQKK